jgi:hypothetical protein
MKLDGYIRNMNQDQRETIERIAKQKLYFWSGEEMAANMVLLWRMGRQIDELIEQVNKTANGRTSGWPK